MSDNRLRREHAELLKQSYLKSGFKQGFEAGYAKAKEDFKRPNGKWIFKNGKYRCSVCLEPCATFCMNEPRDNFCLYCGSDNRRGDIDG